MDDRYKSGDRIKSLINDKTGHIVRLRSDEYERSSNWPIEYYHYSVEYDDGTYESYEPEFNLIRISDGQDG